MLANNEELLSPHRLCLNTTHSTAKRTLAADGGARKLLSSVAPTMLECIHGNVDLVQTHICSLTTHAHHLSQSFPWKNKTKKKQSAVRVLVYGL